jgi:hypothetical protein
VNDLETALHAIDTMIAAMDRANEAMAQALGVIGEHSEEIAELRENDAALSHRLEGLTRAITDGGGLHSVKA